MRLLAHPPREIYVDNRQQKTKTEREKTKNWEEKTKGKPIKDQIKADESLTLKLPSFDTAEYVVRNTLNRSAMLPKRKQTRA